MNITRVRAQRAVGMVCLLIAATGALVSSEAAGASGPSEGVPITVRGGRLPVYAYPPARGEASETAKEPGARPVTIYLHGICGDPGNGCPYFKDGVTSSSWLLCPSAPTPCPGGGATWSGPFATEEAAIRKAEEETEAMHPGAVDTTKPHILIGFSQGGYLGRSELRANPGRYRGALFIGADVEVTAKDLRDAGVKRIALGAGRFDGTYRPLAANAERLRAEGFPVRFVDLGKVGHTYAPATDEPVLRDALAWLEEAY